MRLERKRESREKTRLYAGDDEKSAGSMQGEPWKVCRLGKWARIGTASTDRKVAGPDELE